MSSNLPISARVRPNSEAAPWVIDEIRDLEARTDRLAGALRVLLPLLARDEDRAVTGIFGGDTLDAIDAARALIDDDGADDAGLRYESEKAQLRAEIDRLQSNLTASASAFAALEAVAAEARRNDAIAMSWISEAKHAIGYEGDMPGFIEALRALKADPWPTIARGMITPAHIAPPCKAPPPPNDLEASIRDRIARFAATDDLAKDAADAVLEIVRPLAERSDRLECALREVKEAVEFTPLGVRGIKALQAARAALEELK